MTQNTQLSEKLTILATKTRCGKGIDGRAQVYLSNHVFNEFVNGLSLHVYKIGNTSAFNYELVTFLQQPKSNGR